MKKNRRPLLLLVVIFIAPLALAFWLYYGSTWRPKLHTNHGTLIDPAVTLPVLPVAAISPSGLTGKWSLVVVGGGVGCDEGCRGALGLCTPDLAVPRASSRPAFSACCWPARVAPRLPARRTARG
jgi:hypothetical protein